MGCPNCKCGGSHKKTSATNILNGQLQKNKIKAVYDKIVEFRVYDYINEESRQLKQIEVVLDDFYIIEIDNIDSDNIDKKFIAEYLVKNSLIHID